MGQRKPFKVNTLQAGSIISPDINYLVVSDEATRNLIVLEKRRRGLIVTWEDTGLLLTRKFNSNDLTDISWEDHNNWIILESIESIEGVINIANGVTGYLQVGAVSKNNSVIIEYYFERGSLEGTGRVTLTKNAGTKLTENTGGGDDHLIYFAKEINGDEICLTWDDTDAPDGNATVIRYIQKNI